MKNLQKFVIVFTALLLCAQMASAQNADTSLSSASKTKYDLYMQRHNTFNNIGYGLLVPGGIMVIVGFAGILSDNILSSSYETYATVFCIGGVMALGSIPCLILAHRNKKKAMLHFESGSVAGIKSFNYTGMGLKIQF